ncbi:PQ loop repeat-domain-containing protein [Powellomyces hirtus]|nr:PQ loop repeat-domain-containing protein [Powellomyces hirtus]
MVSVNSPSAASLFYQCPPPPYGLPPDAHANPFLQFLLHECAYTPRATASIFLGYASIAFWICAQMPQLWKNWSQKHADSLSGAFLANWLSGDICNLLGCILTNQLAFQTHLAMYFVFADTLLMLQYLYYKRTRRARLGSRSALFIPLPPSSPSQASLQTAAAAAAAAGDPSEHSPLLTPTQRSSGNFFGIILFAFTTYASAPLMPSIGTVPSQVMSPQQISGEPHAATTAQTIGLFVAYTCTTLYLSSRLPQIYHNFVRRSTAGLSMSMFVCAAMGNLTYVLSILSNSTNRASLVAAAPYLIGSGGTLGFDAVIFVQWWWYKRLRSHQSLLSHPLHLKMDDEEESELEWAAAKVGDVIV